MIGLGDEIHEHEALQDQQAQQARMDSQADRARQQHWTSRLNNPTVLGEPEIHQEQIRKGRASQVVCQPWRQKQHGHRNAHPVVQTQERNADQDKCGKAEDGGGWQKHPTLPTPVKEDDLRQSEGDKNGTAAPY